MPKVIYVVTGGRASGKTTAAVTLPPFAEIDKLILFDTEDSAERAHAAIDQMTNGQKNFTWVRAYERFSLGEDMLARIAAGNLPWVNRSQKSTLVSYYEWFIGEIDRRLEPGKYKYLAIDTVEPVEAALAAWAESNKDKSGWSGSRRFGLLEVEAVRPLYENFLESLARRGIEYIVLTTHLKRVWENDQPVVNKVQPGGRLAMLSRLSTRMFWLFTDSDNPTGAPSAVVLKSRDTAFQLDETTGRLRPHRALPPRIPAFTWDAVDGYVTAPVDFTNLKPQEQLTKEEKETISEFLTDEQMRLMVMDAQKELLVLQSEQMPLAMSEMGQAAASDPTERVVAMLDQGLSDGEIVAALPGVGRATVIRIRAKWREGREDETS